MNAPGLTPAAARMEASLAVIDAREPDVRAFTHLADRTAVRARAAVAVGPLAGVAVAVKEIIDVAGMPVTYGSPLFADRIASADAVAVARLTAAGAVVVGMLTTTPYACGTTTITRNPHALDHTPGGSSAGSGAAVGAGMVPLALGSQSQASTLRPASYCGAWGYKPTHLALPREGMHLLADTLDDLGVFAESLPMMEAAALALGEIERVATPTRLRIGRMRFDDGGLVAEATDAALDALVDRLASVAGIELVEVSLDPAAAAAIVAMDEALQGSGTSCFDIFAGEAAPTLAPYVAAGEPDPRLSEMVAHAASIGAEGLARALAHRADLRAQWDALAVHCDLVITHAVVNQAPPGHASTGDRRLPATSSLLGVPALSAPWMTVDGLPHGAQLVGFAGHDAELLAAARCLAAAEEETR